MSITLTLTDLVGAPLEAGLDLELLGDGKPVARARTQDDGVAVFDLAGFDLGSAGFERLAVRLDADAPDR